ncbi:hypothetical protein D3C81_1987310 [compost metagenome]
MRIDTQPGVSELGHVGFTDHYSSRLQQTLHYRCVLLGHRSTSQHPRTGSSHLSTHVKQVFD